MTWLAARFPKEPKIEPNQERMKFAGLENGTEKAFATTWLCWICSTTTIAASSSQSVGSLFKAQQQHQRHHKIILQHHGSSV